MAGLSYPPESTQLVTLTLEQRAGSEKHAQAIVDAWLSRSREWPKPSDIAQLAAEIENPDNLVKRAREDCEYCHGDGFRSVAGPYGTSAAYPCSHKPMTDSDRRMGVPMPRGAGSMYQREHQAIPGRTEAFNEHAKAHPKEFMQRATVPQEVLDATGGLSE